MNFNLIFLLCFAAFCSADEEVTELKTETLSKPETCSRAAARGDVLSMHYKGSLLSGKEFDSRYVKLIYMVINFIFYLFVFLVILETNHLNFNLV